MKINRTHTHLTAEKLQQYADVMRKKAPIGVAAEYRVSNLDELANNQTYTPLKILQKSKDDSAPNGKIQISPQEQSKIQLSVNNRWVSFMIFQITHNMWVNPSVIINIAQPNYNTIENHDDVYDRSKSSMVCPIGSAVLKVV